VYAEPVLGGDDDDAHAVVSKPAEPRYVRCAHRRECPPPATCEAPTFASRRTCCDPTRAHPGGLLRASAPAAAAPGSTTRHTSRSWNHSEHVPSPLLWPPPSQRHVVEQRRDEPEPVQEVEHDCEYVAMRHTGKVRDERSRAALPGVVVVETTCGAAACMDRAGQRPRVAIRRLLARRTWMDVDRSPGRTYMGALTDPVSW